MGAAEDLKGSSSYPSSASMALQRFSSARLKASILPEDL
jgi:hypothetical protein